MTLEMGTERIRSPLFWYYVDNDFQIPSTGQDRETLRSGAWQDDSSTLVRYHVTMGATTLRRNVSDRVSLVVPNDLSADLV